MCRIIAVVAVMVALLVETVTAQASLIDTRDGQMYKTVKIGNQVWMAQNLNYKTSDGSMCYNDSASYCKKYGRLYNWYTAKSVCPAGWRLPDSADWDILAATVGGVLEPSSGGGFSWSGAGKKLKSKSGWNDYEGKSGNGTDNYGFSALPGSYHTYHAPCDNCWYTRDAYVGEAGSWWTASIRVYPSGVREPYTRHMHCAHDKVNRSTNVERSVESVRCIKE